MRILALVTTFLVVTPAWAGFTDTNCSPTLQLAPKILVLYDSQSADKRTEKIAKLVAKGARSVADAEVRVKSIEVAKAEDVIWADGVISGSPTQLGSVSGKMKLWWDEQASELWSKIDGKFGAAFTSVGSLGGGGEMALFNMNIILQNFGFLTMGTTDYSGKKFSFHYGASVVGEPRSPAEVGAAIGLGKRLTQWVAVYFYGMRECHPSLLSQSDRFPEDA